MNQLRNLDVLRSLAVLCVVANHVGDLFQSSSMLNRIGRFGVLAFFVHTALVLMLSIERISDHPGWPLQFYVRRAFRIYPLTITLIAAVLLFHVPPAHTGARAVFVWPPVSVIFQNLFLIQNFSFPDVSLIGPLWSLPYEVQMYILLPVAFWLARRGYAAFAFGGSIAIALTENLFFRSTVSLTIYFPCFMAGVLAYSRLHRKRVLPWFLWPVLVLGVALLLVLAPFSDPLQWTVCLLIGMAIPLFEEIPHGMISRICSLVARYSYGLYLCHVPLLWFCLTRPGAKQDATHALLCATLLIIVPVCLYHGIEKPMISLGRKITSPRPAAGSAPQTGVPASVASVA